MLRIRVPTRPGEAAPGHQGTDGPVTTLSTTFGESLERVPCIITLVQVRTATAVHRCNVRHVAGSL
jgi:hypothetical protein